MLVKSCPLAPAQVELLQVCINHRTTSDKPLARALFLSPKTIHTQFQRICALLEAHTRTEALLIAIENGWVCLPSDGNPTPA
jgi:DNA-binding NarL/FixJ family response regulator